MKWYVSVPVWGDHYHKVFERVTAPAIQYAMDYAGINDEVSYLIHTDDSERVKCALHGHGETFPVLGNDRGFMALSECHRHAINMTPKGSPLVLLTADLVVSREIIETALSYIKAKKLLVCCAGVRTIYDRRGVPPVGVSGPSLASWAWDEEHRHPMTWDCTWPDGCSMDVWRMYFEKYGSVVTRVNLPHPLVFVKDGRPIRFAPTIDVNVIQNFSTREMVMITDAKQGFVAELSPPEKGYIRTTTMRERFDNVGIASVPEFRPIQIKHHRWFFNQPVRILGEGSAGDEEVAARMLKPV